MSETPKFNYEKVLQICTSQELVLEESRKRKAESEALYETNLKKYKAAKEELGKTETTLEALSAEAAAKLSLVNYYNQQQMNPNERIGTLNTEILKIERKMRAQSDRFANAVRAVVTRIQNLETEFDEVIIATKKAQCMKEAQVLKKQIKDMEEKCNEHKRCAYDFEYYEVLNNLNQLQSDANSTMAELKSEFLHNHEENSRFKSNVEFLKQKNAEWEAQCNVLN